MNKFYILLFLALSLCNNELDELDSLIFSHFQKFIKKYQKKYTSLDEFLSRFANFKKNLIETLADEGTSYKTGINQFSDLTKEEFGKQYLNLKLDFNSNIQTIIINNENEAPSEFDWRDRNVVTGVKDQLECDSTYAFSAIGNLEGLYALEKNVLKEFSIQMILDCDTIDSSCNGGAMQYTFDWIKQNGGINFEEDYPYGGYKRSCRSIKSKYADMKVTGYKKLGNPYSEYDFDPVDENDMKEFLYKTGPLCIAINGYGIFSYSSGVIDKDETKCPSSGINHGALLVGYGNDPNSGLDYWIVKNSWGPRWGENGYFRMRRGNGTCGINCYVLTATVEFD